LKWKRKKILLAFAQERMVGWLVLRVRIFFIVFQKILLAFAQERMVGWLVLRIFFFDPN
jgi:hypothetical protein